MIIDRGDHIEIIELRADAQPSVIGRLLCYLMLWKDDPPSPLPVRGLIVTNRADDDVERCAELHGLSFLEV